MGCIAACPVLIHLVYIYPHSPPRNKDIQKQDTSTCALTPSALEPKRGQCVSRDRERQNHKPQQGSFQPKLPPQRLPKPPDRLRDQVARRGRKRRAEEHAVPFTGVFPRFDVGLVRPFRTEKTPLDHKNAFGHCGLHDVFFDLKEGFGAGLVVWVKGVVDLDPVLSLVHRRRQSIL